MSTSNQAFVRTNFIDAEPAPRSESGPLAWIRKNLLATPKDVVLTALAVALLAWALPHVVNWLFIQAVWSGTDRTFCATTVQGGTQPDGWSGACWAFVNAKFDQFVFGRYPLDERWRVNLTWFLGVAGLVWLLVPRIGAKAWGGLLFFVIFPLIAFWLRNAW